MSTAVIVSKYKEKVKTIDIHSKIEESNLTSLSGLSGNLNVIVPLSVSQKDSFCHCFIIADKEKALIYYSNLCNFLKKEKVYFFPYSFIAPYDDELINNANVVMRTEVIQALLEKSNEKIYIVTYPEGLFERFPEERAQKEKRTIIKIKDKLNLVEFIEGLNKNEFNKVDFVTEPGDYAVRGNIIDVFSYSYKKPIRIELDGNDVERLRLFDSNSQLTESDIKSVKIISNNDNGINYNYVSLFTFLKKEWVLWTDEVGLSANIIEEKYIQALKTYDKISNNSKVVLSLPPEKKFLDHDSFLKEIKRFKSVEFGRGNKTKRSLKINYQSSPQPKFNKNLSLLVEDLKAHQENKYSITISFQSEEQSRRLSSYFESVGFDVNYKKTISKLSEGFVDHENKSVFYTDHEIFNRYFKHTHTPKISKKQKNPIKDRGELKTGDYIVHIDHGVGRFVGLEKMKSGESEHEVLRLVYKNNDIVFINVNSLHKIAKYTGSGEPPILNSLNNQEWIKKKKKIKTKIVDMANDLIQLYLKRREVEGYAFDKDSYLQIELESSFIYQDTPDQIKTTEEVKKDMEGVIPMDRLVCGDVGFGKTEIAVRAAFKAVCSNRQVLILVPTTILAFQHYKTFKKRLENFPVKIDYISRFRSTKDKRRVINSLKEGKTDIIIGTHSVLSKKIEFKKLGLLIVDEEQKFGVALKEKIKKQKLNLDCLTLTATPIPRTLHFSLIGVRDISIIRTPPTNRQPVHTEVLTFDENEIRDIINNEISRFGQVFFVHNRVENIYEIANIVQKLVPNAKVAVAHGQQKGDLLEKTILDFVDGRFDVLVSTNIIESGLDIPNANTIIINQAHMFGLSDLHQMRGRVGRSNRKAFCRLLVPKLSSLNVDAKKRLFALEEFSNLGDGLNIAMKDLDIRGAGNLLGGEQSGFINDLGFETYNKILDEALSEVDLPKQNKTIKEFVGGNCLVDPEEKAFIPKGYISNSDERLKIYGLIEEKSKKGNFDEIITNLEDRFGKIPEEVFCLIEVMKIKQLASKIGVDKILIKQFKVSFVFFNNEKNTNNKQEVVLFLLNKLNSYGHKTDVKEKKTQLSIICNSLGSVTETLVFLKKTTKKQQ
jgi:transcription-repair coupling factor (superfamily II helicase)